MKKLLYVIAFLAIGFVSNAQFLVGGQVGINYTKTKDATSLALLSAPSDGNIFSFTLAPNVLYQLDSKMGVGAKLGIDFMNMKNNQDNTKDKIFMFQLNPYFRYNVLKVSKINLYCDAQVAFGLGKRKTDGVADQNITNLGFNIIPGAKYDLTNMISLTAELNLLQFGFNYLKCGDQKITQFGLGADTQTNITVGILFNM